MIDDDEELPESRRQRAKRERREAGESSARLARALMAMPEAVLGRLALDEGLREAVERARAVTAHGARQREQRRLAGELRRFDLAALAAEVEGEREEGHAEVRLLHQAEAWRARLLGDDAALAAWLAEHPSVDPRVWQELCAAGRKERDSGKPRGAARALFRAVIDVLRRDG